MDKKDMSIIKLLSENARLSVRKIANKLNMKPSSVFNRMKKMEKSIIKRYTIDVDRRALGYNVLAYIFISYSPTHKGQERLTKELSTYPQVIESSIITGEWDIILKVVEKDVDALGKFVTDVIRKKSGVSKTTTMIVLKDVKQGVLTSIF